MKWRLFLGIATYDHYFGEAFFATKPGFEELEKDILEYTTTTFSNENGLGIAVNDKDTHTLDLLRSKKFVENDLTENILELTLQNVSLDYVNPEGVILKNMDVNNDLFKYRKLLWKGFNHEGPVPDDEITIDKKKRMLSARNMNSFLHIVAENEDGEYVAYCGLWYSQKTDYVYVEPVCTIPEYRQKGLGKAVVLEALKRGRSLGAEKAYVISDSSFYKSIGFQQHSHFTFYWHNI
ncbi:GNAT family N-acetyltransferase [Paenibacillus tundrae]|uniref:GNAT family N-acetyltransferase n=1 Tax=Paenibacillus tundrae TaxID=528187 RepID=UPI0022A941DB|nr:GNAT family N-acetyltransferase [Paenibacillus tundrae]